MEIAVVGINHNNAPVDVRERAAFTESSKIDVINELMDSGIEEAVVLSTCNRSEVYVAYSKKIDGKNILKDIYKKQFKYVDLDLFLFAKKGQEAIEHIFRVASGMDSIVLGEDQILGQVKDSLILSMELGSSKKLLNRLFRDAVTAAKEIKNKLKISEIPLSTSYIGVKLLKERIGDLKGKNVLIIGVGQISKLTLKYLLLEDFNSIKITNRTHGKLKELSVKSEKIELVNYSDRYEVLNEVDVVISATSAPHVILRMENMPELNKKLYILDLAVPRDIDPKVREGSYVELLDIDDLEKISSNNMEKREGLKEQADEIIREYIFEFNEWKKRTKIDPVIKDLKEKCDEIEKDTLEYIFRKSNMELRDQKIVQKMLNSALKRVIRDPIIKLKELEDDERENYMDVVKELFKL
ncbi:glutamyl-tRNA reductase [Oceanirhabdus sp. W0125-5]|uniref:glutamyl-tRNA reductase n=1 Tax=Oceanirhabdus sp. W0125-5 TaxID=2999116 RepID=UPI0022F344A6|nr:glutamyl-tRNA reductase [Oceanirhabdus sp. W0125-5]WBW98452.1 glutamyl-tRNA reductase [Oceanirhabdus sp. W0125-5]